MKKSRKRVFWFECRYSAAVVDVEIRKIDGVIRSRDEYSIHTTDGKEVLLDEGLYRSPQDASDHDCMAPARYYIEANKVTNIYGAGFEYESTDDPELVYRTKVRIAEECTTQWRIEAAGYRRDLDERAVEVTREVLKAGKG